MSKAQDPEFKVGEVIFSKADEAFNLPMIIKSLPNSNVDLVTCIWVGSQKTQVHGSFPIEALVRKPTQ
jgi:hypothetical protein